MAALQLQHNIQQNTPTNPQLSPHASCPEGNASPGVPLPEAESVRVVIQARPLLPFELAHNARRAVTIQSNPPTVHVNRPRTGLATASNSATAMADSNSGVDTTAFSSFDAVFDAAPGSAPDALYDQHVSPLVDTLFKGINATVFAYGQTCAGKSYTMRHITTRVATHIFDQKRRIEAAGDVHVAVRIGIVEIYRESIRDLVDGTSAALGTVHVQVRARATGGYGVNSAKSGSAGAADGLKESSGKVRGAFGGAEGAEKRSVYLDGARERCVDSERALIDIVEEGALVRRTAATGMNASSSRSHSIITISVIKEPLDSSTQDKSKCLYSKIHLVDLAGSERAKRTAAGGERFAEGVDINKGLFALAKVISTLADNARRPPSRRAYVPYRDSKLTRLLQDSLGGSARTVLIACVSPADTSAEETLGTLRYAERARHIRNQPKVNKDPNAVEVSDLRAALSRARSKIAALAADNERLRNSASCPSCAKASLRPNEGSREKLKSVKTAPSSPVLGRNNGLSSVNDQSARLPKRIKTAREIKVERSPQLPTTISRLPRRAPTVMSTSMKVRSPSVCRNRRRSQSVSALRVRNRRSRNADSENSSISPSSRTNLRRKRMRGTAARIPNAEDDTAESDSSTEDFDEDDDGDEQYTASKSLSRAAASALSCASMEEMRRTFTERLQQAENDKAIIDAERNRLLQLAHETEEQHQKEIEQIRAEGVARVNKLRAKLADVKRLEAESTRLTKLRDGSDAARKRLQGRVIAAEKSRDETVSRLTEALSRTEVSKMNLGKENRVLVRSERHLRLELQRSIEARSKLEAALTRARSENESMRARLAANSSRIPTTGPIRRVNSSFTPGLGSQYGQKQRHAKGLRD